MASSLEATVRPAKIFASNMVLQQNTGVNVWGWADAGEVVKVTGSWDNVTKTDTSGTDG